MFFKESEHHEMSLRSEAIALTNISALGPSSYMEENLIAASPGSPSVHFKANHSPRLMVEAHGQSSDRQQVSEASIEGRGSSSRSATSPTNGLSSDRQHSAMPPSRGGILPHTPRTPSMSRGTLGAASVANKAREYPRILTDPKKVDIPEKPKQKRAQAIHSPEREGQHQSLEVSSGSPVPDFPGRRPHARIIRARICADYDPAMQIVARKSSEEKGLQVLQDRIALSFYFRRFLQSCTRRQRNEKLLQYTKMENELFLQPTLLRDLPIGDILEACFRTAWITFTFRSHLGGEDGKGGRFQYSITCVELMGLVHHKNSVLCPLSVCVCVCVYERERERMHSD